MVLIKTLDIIKQSCLWSANILFPFTLAYKEYCKVQYRKLEFYFVDSLVYFFLKKNESLFTFALFVNPLTKTSLV